MYSNLIQCKVHGSGQTIILFFQAASHNGSRENLGMWSSPSHAGKTMSEVPVMSEFLKFVPWSVGCQESV